MVRKRYHSLLLAVWQGSSLGAEVDAEETGTHPCRLQLGDHGCADNSAIATVAFMQIEELAGQC